VRARSAAARLVVERAAAVAVVGAALHVVVVGGDATLVDRPEEPVCGGAGGHCAGMPRITSMA